MANFCTKCGRKLIDGQPCICTQQATQQTQQEENKTTAQAAEETKSDVKAQAMNFFTQALEMIKHPSTGFVKSVADENSKNGLILMGIEAILTGLYLYVLLQKIVSTTMGGVNSLLGTSRYAQTPSLGQFFAYGIIIAIIVSLVIAALAMGLMKGMAHAEINWFQSCQISGMRSLGMSLGWILGILGLFVGMYQFSILIIAVGSVLGSIYMIVAMMSYPNTKKDMIAYAILIIWIVSTFVAYFVLKEFIFSSVLNGIGSASNLLNNIL